MGDRTISEFGPLPRGGAGPDRPTRISLEAIDAQPQGLLPPPGRRRAGAPAGDPGAAVAVVQQYVSPKFAGIAFAIALVFAIIWGIFA